MKTKNIFKNLFLATAAIALLAGCVEDDDFGIPNLTCDDPGLTATKTVQEIFDASTGSAMQYTADDIIEGYVVSSDEGGNFFKSISIQAIDGSVGFSVPIDVTDLYTEYEPGRKVYVRLQDRYTAVDFDALEIGDLFGGNQVGRLPETIYRDVVLRSCDFVAEENFVNTINIQDISDQYLNQLIQFENVQFVDDAIGSTYYDAANDLGGATNHLLSDEFGFQVIFRTSSFADFASQPVAEGSGTVRGVLTKFGDDYQLLARTVNDVMLDAPRQSLDRIGLGALRLFEEDDIINDSRFVEGIVILSPNNENNVNSRNAVVQDETGGIVFRFSSDHSLVEGDLVRLPVDGLNTDSFNGLKQLEGMAPSDAQVLSQGNALPEAKILTIAEVQTGDFESQLVQIENVQFVQAEVDAGDDLNGTQNITDCTSTISIFTRSGATFSGDAIATGNGTIIAVASTSNGAQLNLQSGAADDAMSGARCAEPVPFFEESFDTSIPATWTTIATTGTRLWTWSGAGGTPHANMSAFAGGSNPPLDVVTWLISPSIDFDAQNNEFLRIEVADAFENGNPLSVRISTDYTGSGDPTAATWTTIGVDEVAALINNGGFFDNSYEQSGAIDLSTVTGNAYLAFVYDSNGGTISTTTDIGKVSVFAN
ncbi:DUF5689 domain-containing protein [Sungkyunkwania multivorans]|uniref:DUF5689 domain-containing protein n=2 Tax=Sungkyunkwania multivorans TaxID=1173618 RepID=A0ABW3D305_9FLAO